MLLNDSRVANLLAERKDSPESPRVLLELARAYNARLMPTLAREACAELLALDPLHGEGWYEALIAAAFGGPEELGPLAERLEGLAVENPRRANLQRNLGLAYYHLERDDEARAACEAALELDDEDSKAHEVLAYLHTTVGDLDAAVEAGIQAVELDPANFRALHWLGDLYVRLGAPEQAIRYFLRCLRKEECFFFALESLGGLYLADEETFPLAWQCHARILSVNPSYFPAYFRLADAFIQAERFGQAAAQAEMVLHLSPDPTAEADAHQYLGLLALMQDSFTEARSHFQRALGLDPEFAAAHHYLGVACEREADPEGAEACFLRAAKADPEFASPRARLGYLCFDRKEYEAAKRHFEEALEIDAEEYLAHLGLSELARFRKDYDAQLLHCRLAAEQAPDDSNVQNQLATALDALGRAEEAVEHYQRALRLDPYNRQAANNLGYLYERLLKRAGGEDPPLREKAVEAWKRRLLICRDTRSSTRGARSHLVKLGVSEDQVQDWLDHAQLA